MLSRLALTPAASWRIMIVRPCSSLVQQTDADRLIPGPNYPSLKAERAPERDTVNYPRPRRPDEAGKCRLFCVPEEYFQFFYPKTGVTGPYVFGAGLMTYLFSKEILVCEHEFYAGLVLAGVIAAVVGAMGPNVKEDMKKEVEAADAKITCLKEDSVKLLEESINNEKKAQWRAQGQKLLFDAKRENVAVQLETAFRERQMAVYKAVKSRLDYKLEMDVVTRRFQHQHMLDWIVKNVRKSITPDMEKKSLDQCITDLKGLAARA